MSSRKSTRNNLGQKPEHLKDYECDDNSVSDYDSTSSNEYLDSTVMPLEDEDVATEEQNMADLMRQLVKQMGELQTEFAKIKQQSIAGPSTAQASTSEYAQRKSLNASVSPFTVQMAPQDVFMQEFRRPLHDLPSFDGSIEQWPKFYQTYLTTTNTYKYTKLENLVRLEKALRGKAKESVEAMLIHADSVDDAVNHLKFLYGDTDSLIKSQIAKIRELPSIPDHKLEQMINFSTKLENLKTFIISGGCEKYLTNSLLIEELLCKLSVGKRIEWMQYKDNRQTNQHLSSFVIG